MVQMKDHTRRITLTKLGLNKTWCNSCRNIATVFTESRVIERGAMLRRTCRQWTLNVRSERDYPKPAKTAAVSFQRCQVLHLAPWRAPKTLKSQSDYKGWAHEADCQQVRILHLI
jgi:hypothetical protein